MGVNIGLFQVELQKYDVIGIDTSLFIYRFEKTTDLEKLAKVVFDNFNSNLQKGVVSVLALLEVLVQPLRKNNLIAVRDYIDLFQSFPNLSLENLDVLIARKASELRAKYRMLKTPDAIHLATAVARGGKVFITNDNSLRGITEIPVIVLMDYTSSP